MNDRDEALYESRYGLGPSTTTAAGRLVALCRLCGGREAAPGRQYCGPCDDGGGAPVCCHCGKREAIRWSWTSCGPCTAETDELFRRFGQCAPESDEKFRRFAADPFQVLGR